MNFYSAMKLHELEQARHAKMVVICMPVGFVQGGLHRVANALRGPPAPATHRFASPA